MGDGYPGCPRCGVPMFSFRAEPTDDPATYRVTWLCPMDDEVTISMETGDPERMAEWAKAVPR